MQPQSRSSELGHQGSAADDAQAKRRTYARPQLAAYGALRSITRGGSGPMVEGTMMGNKFRHP